MCNTHWQNNASRQQLILFYECINWASDVHSSMYQSAFSSSPAWFHHNAKSASLPHLRYLFFSTTTQRECTTCLLALPNRFRRMRIIRGCTTDGPTNQTHRVAEWLVGFGNPNCNVRCVSDDLPKKHNRQTTHIHVYLYMYLYNHILYINICIHVCKL